MAVAVAYSARLDTPYLIQRGRSETLVCRVYRAGALAPVTEAGSTVTIYDASDTPVVDAAAVTVDADGVATYLLAGATTASLALSAEWRVAWSLVMGDTVTHLYDSLAALVRRAPAPVLTEATLYARVPALDPSGAAAITSRTDFAAQIDEAWTQIVNRFVEAGRRIELVLDPSAIREAHATLTLAMIFEDLAARNPIYADSGASFRLQYETAWGRLAPATDTDDDGDADAALPVRGPVWAM